MTFAEAYQAERARTCEWCKQFITDGVYCTAPTVEAFAQQVWERMERAEKAIQFGFPYGVTLQLDEENDTIATIPDLPGCIAHGSTVAEALTILKGVMDMYLDVLKEDGGVPPEATNLASRSRYVSK